MNTFIVRLCACLGALAVLAGCASAPQAPTIRLHSIVRDAAPATPRWQSADAEAVGLRVWRNFVPLRATAGMPLQAGDVVQTGPGSAVSIVFEGGPGAGTVTVDESSRVRVGSLEVFFGRIFANVRGLFETTSENIVAGVEGTAYLFEVARDRDVHVAVAEGVVACTAKDGSWVAVRLPAGQSLRSAYPNRAAPRVGPADARELRDAAAWAAAVAKAGEPEPPSYGGPQFNLGIGVGGGSRGGRDNKPQTQTETPRRHQDAGPELNCWVAGCAGGVRGVGDAQRVRQRRLRAATNGDALSAMQRLDSPHARRHRGAVDVPAS